MRALLVLVALVGVARAGEAPSFAVAVNTPISWITSVAGSAYVGTYDRHAIRFNIASSDTWERLPAALFGAEVEGKRVTLTVGAGFVFYPRERFRGFSYELGAFHRDREILEWGSLGERTVTDTQTWAAYGLVGYSVLLLDHIMIATAIGGSFGYEHGMRSREALKTMNTRISRPAPEVEAYLRFGYAFSL